MTNPVIRTMFAVAVAGSASIALLGAHDAQAASKKTGCVKNATNTQRTSCEQHKRVKYRPTGDYNNGRQFNFKGSDLSHTRRSDPGGPGGGGGDGGQR